MSKENWVENCFWAFKNSWFQNDVCPLKDFKLFTSCVDKKNDHLWQLETHDIISQSNQEPWYDMTISQLALWNHFWKTCLQMPTSPVCTNNLLHESGQNNQCCQTKLSANKTISISNLGLVNAFWQPFPQGCHWELAAANGTHCASDLCWQKIDMVVELDCELLVILFQPRVWSGAYPIVWYLSVEPPPPPFFFFFDFWAAFVVLNNFSFHGKKKMFT